MKHSQWLLLGVGILILSAGVALVLIFPRLPLPASGGIGTAGITVITAAVASSRAITITVQLGGRSGNGGT